MTHVALVKDRKLEFREITGVAAQRDWEKLVNRCFQVAPGSTFLDDFPVWDEQHGTQLFRVGAYSGKTLVATAGARLATLGGGSLPVGIVGAVATHPDWRGHGLGSENVARVLRWLTEKGAALAVLWGSEHGMYRRLGFELCGSQSRIPLGDLVLPSSAGGLTVHAGWHPEIFRLMLGRTGGLKHGAADGRWIAAHKNVKWWWIGDRSPLAYGAIGRGIDLGGLAHEWGGEPAALKKLLGHLRRQEPNLEIIGSPDLLAGAGIVSNSAHESEYLCMARVLDPVRVIRAFHPGLECSIEAAAHGGAKLTVGKASFPVKGEEDYSRLLFGGAKGTIFTAGGALPLPLWFWGLDGA